MTPTTILEEVQLNIPILQWHLINVRVCNQEVQLIRDLADPRGLSEAERRIITSLNRRVAGSKSEAKKGLIYMERVNERQWRNGENWYPLHEYLNGKQFRLWPCYAAIYKDHWLFKGVDPN